MREFLNHKLHLGSLRQLVCWLVMVPPVAALAGSASAGFLWLLNFVTGSRVSHPWLLFFLPVAGILIFSIYRAVGGNADRGTNLILDEIHKPGGGVPVRMAPLVLLTTLITHLFGGSAGREGTAVQMGGGLASGFIEAFRIRYPHRRMLLMAGMAAGFGSVFGTPLAGAVFAMEVLAVGRIRYESLVPCLIAGLIGDFVCSAWGIHHTSYHIDAISHSGRWGAGHFDWVVMGYSLIAGIAFGLAALLFSEFTHAIQQQFRSRIPYAWLRPALGGALVIGLTFVLGTRSYLGLGVVSADPGDVTIVSCFHPGGATAWSWIWKLIMTAITLGSGFKGGEVTPLFFIGAALGNVLSRIFGVPTDLFAGLGFVAVFAGASNTPLACTLMGIELFGAGHAPYLASACFVAYLFSGHSGIYGSQRLATPKILEHDAMMELTLAELRSTRDRPASPPPDKSA
jgi:H+/Cl- antiporter ClcA